MKVTAIYEDGRDTLVLCNPNEGDKFRRRGMGGEIDSQVAFHLRSEYPSFFDRQNFRFDHSFEVTSTKSERRFGLNFFYDHPHAACGKCTSLIFAEGGFIRVLKDCVIKRAAIEESNITNTVTYTVEGAEILTALPA